MITEQEIINGFQLLVSVLGIILGIVSLFFTRKLIEKQIKNASKHKDMMNQKIAEGLSRPYIYVLTKVLGIIFIIFFAYQLIGFL